MLHFTGVIPPQQLNWVLFCGKRLELWSQLENLLSRCTYVEELCNKSSSESRIQLCVINVKSAMKMLIEELPNESTEELRCTFLLEQLHLTFEKRIRYSPEMLV